MFGLLCDGRVRRRHHRDAAGVARRRPTLGFTGFGELQCFHRSTTINASAGFLDPSGARVFTAVSFSIGNNDNVLINGAVTDYVVIDITGAVGNKRFLDARDDA